MDIDVQSESTVGKRAKTLSFMEKIGEKSNEIGVGMQIDGRLPV
jgi:hypothetical protein